MMERERARETQLVVNRVMKMVQRFDRIGKQEFEAILGKIIEQVHKNTGIDEGRVADVTSAVVEDMPQEYGRLGEPERSREAMIAYLYLKYLQQLRVV